MKDLKIYKNTKNFVTDLIGKIKKDEVSNSSASLSYYFILSFFPLLLFLMASLSYLPINQAEIYTNIYEIMPNSMGEFLIRTLREILDVNHTNILTFGILTTIYSASSGIYALMHSFNKSYDIKDSRNFIIVRLISILILIIIIIVISLMVLSIVFGDYLIRKINIPDTLFFLWKFLKNLFPLLFTFISLNFVYLLSINLKLKFRDVWVGSVFSTITIFIITKLFSIYVSEFSRQTVVYGSVGAVMMLVFWLYLMAYILVIGSEINSILYKNKNIDSNY